jgi:hypothetical protein
MAGVLPRADRGTYHFSIVRGIQLTSIENLSSIKPDSRPWVGTRIDNLREEQPWIRGDACRDLRMLLHPDLSCPCLEFLLTDRPARR